MGQKTNPKILRLGNTKLYNYSHIEKKSSEFAFYDFKILEINNFVYKFFKDQNLTVQNCKINYSDSETLHIFISYFANLNTSTNIQNKKEIN